MNNMKELRKRAGMKQEAVASALGAKQASISEWESGKKTPSLEAAIQLSRIFNVSLGCVVGLEPIPDGYPDDYTRPVIYNEEIEPKKKVAEETTPFRRKKPPFSKEQMDYLDEWGDRLTERIVDSLKEDTSSSSGA